MKEQYDIAPVRKRAGVFARDVEEELSLPISTLGAIEDGRIGIDTETYDQIHGAIKTIAARKKEKEATECDREVLASAST